jgi:DNA polymerase-3 subunit delta
MKLTSRQIDSFIKTPDKAVRAILVYGPDHGLVKERAKSLALTIVSDINDPFNVSHLTGEIFEKDVSRFLDEVNAQSLMGGQRIVRITDLHDKSNEKKLTALLKDWLKTSPNDNTLVVIEAGELGKSDTLRKLCEDQPNAAAIPCYLADDRDLAQAIRQMISKQDKSIDNDAILFLQQTLKGDRSILLAEIEKLCLYVGYSQTNITLADAQANSGDTGETNLDDLIYAVFEKNAHKALSTYRKLVSEGIEQIIIQRSLQNHVRRLHQVKINIEENGLSYETASKKLYPPVFYKFEDSFRGQVQKFSSAYLRKLLVRLNELEAESKKTGNPSITVLSDALLKLAS